MVMITIITPAYNRATMLPKLYASLQDQTDTNFQWLVVDDGSTDDTKEVMKNIQEHSQDDFEITFVSKQNGGKHTALNYGHQYISGDYTLVVDSDDKLYPEAIEVIIEEIITTQNKDKIGWFAFLMGDENRNLLDTPYEHNHERITYVDYLNRGRKGECADVYLTKAFTAHPYPEVENEKFVSESYLNIQAALFGGYEMITINQLIKEAEYQEGGLTSLGRMLQLSSPIGNALLWRPVVNKPFSLPMRFKGNLLFTVYSLFGRKKLKQIIKKSANKTLTIISLPFSYILYFYWKRKFKQV
ncbi:glycosyltransferase family 2 protein [Aerococcus urinaeequi]|uniref:glycosyltransferase family 2 protein n=1 Tax=Aerococcus urinaeequi TaxID=51665 RepID=UPI003D6A3FE4